MAVCLTSYGARLRFVHYTIQSIANGDSRPEQIILWIGRSDAHLVTPQLRHLESRGLTIRLTEDYGAHTKYYPYCTSLSQAHGSPLALVTADDDIIYPTDWLRSIMQASAEDSEPTIVAHRAHQMKISDGVIYPYLSWALGAGTVQASYMNVATGVCGVYYPLEFVLQVANRWGLQFLDLAPSADDLWLHSRAVLLGIRTKQIARRPAHIKEHHPYPSESLAAVNVTGGCNDITISRIYTSDIISKICGDDALTDGSDVT